MKQGIWILWCCLFGMMPQLSSGQTAPAEFLVDTIINRSAISQGRMQLHIRIAKEQNKADIMDGLYDRFVDRGGNASLNKKLSEALFYHTDRTIAYIENNIADDLEKRRYLARIIQTLSNFNRDIDYGLINKTYYTELVHHTFGLIQSIHRNKAKQYIDENIGESLYALKTIFDTSSVLYTTLLMAMADKHPDMLLNDLRNIRSPQVVDRIIAGAAKTHPKRILNLATSTAIEREWVKRNPDLLVREIVQIADSATIPLRAIYFLEPLRTKKITYQEVNRLCANDLTFYQAIVRLRAYYLQTPLRNFLDAEMNHAAKYYVNTMNELHNAGDAVRFRCIQPLNATELYYVMVFGGDELYTSSFLGCYKRLASGIKPLSGYQFLDSLHYDKFRTFIRLCANYNTLNEFLGTMPPDAKTDLMNAFVLGLDRTPEGNLEGATDVASSLGSISDTALLHHMIETIRQERNRFSYLPNYKGYKIYRILYAMMVMNSDSLYRYFGIPPITYMPIQQLADSGKPIVQQVFFYGDADGKGSFNAWLNQFYPPQWQVIPKTYWVEIRSMKGHPVHLFANRPFSEPNDEIAQQFLKRYLDSLEVKPSVLIHRGHSYHLPITLSYLNDNHKVVILGACGAYQQLSAVLTASPNAHIISSKQIGAGKINGPIINAFNKRLLEGKDIDWVLLWEGLRKQFSSQPGSLSLFNDYVPPYKNMGALFLKAYQQ